MSKFEQKKQILAEKSAEYVLKNGLSDSSLKALAEHCKTSDRMLMYYFETKEELLNEVFGTLTQQLVDILKKTQPKSMNFVELFSFIEDVVSDASLRPYLKIWMEIVSKSASNSSPVYKESGKRILEQFKKWITEAMTVSGSRKEKAQIRSLALVNIEGMVLLNALGLNRISAEASKGLELLINNKNRSN